MKCDSDHATIERAKKSDGILIELLDEWYQSVKTAGKKKSFDVNVMTQEHYHNTITFFKNAYC